MSTSDLIQKLPETLSKNGNSYRLIKRGERALIYAEGPNGQNLAFEVFQIKIQKAGEMFGKFYPNRERFPGNEDFGKWAIWCNSEKKAMEWFAAFEQAPFGSAYNELWTKVDIYPHRTTKAMP